MAASPCDFSREMRTEWTSLKAALDACVERHVRRQEQLFARLNRAAEAPNGESGDLSPPCRPETPASEAQRAPSSPGFGGLDGFSEAAWQRSMHPSKSSLEREGDPTSPPRRTSCRSNEEKVSSASQQILKTKVTTTWNTEALERGKLSGMVKRAALSRCSRCFRWWWDLQEPPRESRLARFVHHGIFEAICASVIIANSLFAAAAANWEEENAFNGVRVISQEVVIGEISFLSFYCVELALKLAVHGLYFFVNEDMYWNIFDTGLVAFSLYDEIMTSLFNVSIGANVTFMRSLRILKMAKILRVVRVMRYFAELRLILQSLIGSLASLFWSIIMLMLIFYIFALCFVQGVTAYVHDMYGQLDSDNEAVIWRYFGTVQHSMLTLYKASTGGDDWSLFWNIIVKTGPIYSALFIFFVAFIQIALFNILTAIFVENAMKLAQPDRDAMALQVRKSEMAEKQELRRLCKALDVNDDGCLDIDEFAKHLNHGKLKAYLAVLGLDVRDAEVFLKVLSSAAQDAPIEIESFVEGCMRMKGVASSIDLQGLTFETKVIHKSLRSFYRDVLERFDSLSSRVRQLTDGGGVQLPSATYSSEPVLRERSAIEEEEEEAGSARDIDASAAMPARVQEEEEEVAVMNDVSFGSAISAGGTRRKPAISDVASSRGSVPLTL